MNEITTEQISKAWKSRPDLQKEFETMGAKGKTADWTIYDWAKKYGQQELPDIFGAPGQAKMGLDNVNNNQTADQYINGNQTADFNKKVAEQAPLVREPIKSTDPLSEVNAKLTEGATPPTTPNLLEIYNTERKTRGINDLEASINDYDKQIKDLEASIRAEQINVNAEGISASGRNARMTDFERGAREKIDAINREKTYAVNELNTKNKVLETIMGLTKEDYTTAKDSYDTKFSQALQMQNLINQKEERDKTAQDRQQDNARADLQIMLNEISKGSLDLSQIPDDQKVIINKLELQSGFPVGFTQYLKSTNPKADVVATSSHTDPSGNHYIDVIMKDTTTGALKTHSEFVGREKVSGTGTAKTIQSGSLILTKGDIGQGESRLDQSRGKDGYSDTNTYLGMKDHWAKQGGSLKDFLSYYPPKQYLNPNDPLIPEYLKQYLKKDTSSSGSSIDFNNL